MIVLSVIVPVYNAAKYLPRCLDSLLNQDVEQYEIICVNDGSTDNSGVILHEYQKKNPQVVRIVEQNNQGLPAARNAGIAVAKGSIIAFCDSDDYLIPGAYGYILRTFWKDGVDLLKFKSITIDRYVQKGWNDPQDVRGVLKHEGAGIQYMKEEKPHLCFVWSYMYRKEFLSDNHIHFRSIAQCEDVAFNMDVYMCDPYVVEISSNVYRYTVSPEQLTRIREPYHMRRVVGSYLHLFGYMNDYMQKKPELKETLVEYRQREMISCMSRALSAGYTKKEFFSVKQSFLMLEVLPMCHSGRTSTIINRIMANYFSYTVASFFYRRLFIPYILPLLGRN